MLNSEVAKFGTNIPSPTGAPNSLDPTGDYHSNQRPWSLFAEPAPIAPNFQVATHAVGLSPLRGSHYENNQNLDKYSNKEPAPLLLF